MDVTVTKEYKDRLFRLVFQDKKDLLSLYNAVNKSSYENPEELQILTLENMIYLKMKNDISFLLGDILNLYEHQSTVNPNMPVRGFLYFAEMYQKYLMKYKYRLFSTKLIMLPRQQNIVFYNGLQNQPDRFELKYKILRLIQLLISNSRSDEIEKAVNNKNYRNQPFDEFGL